MDESDRKIEIDSSGQINKLVEILNKNPYKHLQSLVISPLLKNINQEDNLNVTFNFSRAFIQKSTNPIKDLNVNFGDGQVHPIIENRHFENSIISHSFSTEGAKTLIFVGVFQDGTSFETYSAISIVLNPPPEDIITLRASENFTPYIPDEEAYYNNYMPNNEFSEIKYKVFYSTDPPRTEIMKPIIIVDGIDYNDEHNCDYIYDELLKLDDTGERLGNRLRELGYDVIIGNFPTYKIGTVEVDIPTSWNWFGFPLTWETETIDTFRKGGADYIQRNAQAVKELIRTINNELITNESSEKLIVVGPSMGGLVTRWALKEMENNGENHNVDIWVSFDAPQQGANIPTALQYAADYQNEYSSLDKLKRKAARQMLVHHYLAEEQIPYYPSFPFFTYGLISEGAPGFRNRFKNELSTLGYPQQNLRKVALVNGSTTGEIVNNTGGELAYTHLWMDSFPWSNILEGYLYFTGNNGNNKVMDFDFTKISKENDVKKYTNTNNLIGSYDNSPGCIIEMLGDFSIDVDIENMHQTFFIINFWIDGYVSQSADSFSFMPTKSTLDFQGSTLLSEPICYNLVTSNETPFDSYYAPEQNEPHVQLNTNNVNWMLDEFASLEPTEPPTYCEQPIILALDGLNNLCSPNTATYTLSPNNLTNVQWSETGYLQIMSSNEQQITVKMNDASFFEYGIITANVGTNNVSKFVYCPYFFPFFRVNYNETGNIIVSLESEDNEIPLELQGITDVQWELTSGDSSILNATDKDVEILGNNFTGKITLTNDNGSTTKYFFWPDPDNCNALVKVGTDKYQVIDRCNDNEVINTIPIKELYDISGNKISDIPVYNQELDIDNIGNNGSIHIIHIVVNGENLSKVIIKD